MTINLKLNWTANFFNTGTVSPDRLFDSQISPKKVVVEHLEHAYTHSEPKFITSGDLLWSFETGGEIWSSPSIDFDGTVYVGSDDQYVYAINGSDGKLKWKFQTNGKVSSSPVVGTGSLIYVSASHGDRKVYAIDKKSGQKVWEAPGGDAHSVAIGLNNSLYTRQRCYRSSNWF